MTDQQRVPSLLYVGDMDVGTTSRDRADALRELGAAVTPVSSRTLQGWRGKLDWLCRAKLQISSTISSFNADVIAACNASRFDILWLDKGWMIQPETIRKIRDRVGSIVLFNNDNPWGEHERGMWRLHLGLVPLVDEIMVPKFSVVRHYELKGARRVSVVDFGFAPDRHFAPSHTIEKKYDITFIGTALYDGGGIRPHRTEIVLDLARRLPGKISLFGHGWRRAAKGNVHLFNRIEDGAWNDAYRETIWSSRINLSFVTKDNWEEMSHRAFEITASGGCLLAERASRLEQNFYEGREALYFQSAAECVELAGRLLADTPMRTRIAEDGHRRAMSSGYSNVARLREAIGRSPVLRSYFSPSVGNGDSND